MLRIFLLLFAHIIFCGLGVYAQEQVTFKIKNAGVMVDGSFEKFSMDISYDPDNLSSSRFNGTIDVSSLETGIDMRNEHLMGEEYFHANSYSAISFKSTSIVKLTNGDLKVKGSLKIKDVSKNVELTVKPTTSGSEWWFETTFELDRLDYGVGESSWFLSNEVNCVIKASAN